MDPWILADTVKWMVWEYLDFFPLLFVLNPLGVVSFSGKNLFKIEAWIDAEYFPSWVCS